MKVVGIAGSLRRGSLNRSLLRAAIELAPEGMEIDVGDISDIPLYNFDIEEASGFPESVQRLREQIRRADALLIATPEYNYSMPGVLKNAIDWVSRPPDQPFSGKPCAIMGATPGRQGTIRAQASLRQTAVFLDLHILNREVFVDRASEKFDGEGRLTDERTRNSVRKTLVALQEWTRVLQQGVIG